MRQSCLGVIYAPKWDRNNYCHMAISIPKDHVHGLLINHKRTRFHIRKHLWNFLLNDEPAHKNVRGGQGWREGEREAGRRWGRGARLVKPRFECDLGKQQSLQTQEVSSLRKLKAKRIPHKPQTCISVSHLHRSSITPILPPKVTRWMPTPASYFSHRVEKERKEDWDFSFRLEVIISS